MVAESQAYAVRPFKQLRSEQPRIYANTSLPLQSLSPRRRGGGQVGSSQFAVVALFHNLYSWICAVRERLIIAFMLNPLDPLQLHLLGGGLCACLTMTPMTIRRLSNYMLPTIPQSRSQRGDGTGQAPRSTAEQRRDWSRGAPQYCGDDVVQQPLIAASPAIRTEPCWGAARGEHPRLPRWPTLQWAPKHTAPTGSSAC